MSPLLSEVTLLPPLDVMPKRINHPFGEKRSYEIHPGVDLGTPSGTQVKAPMDGEVVFVNSNGRLCGGTIDIDYKNGFWSRFCHIKRIDVKKGDIVKQGQVVGLSGGGLNDPQRGNSKGPHLHFTLKKDGKLVDPMDFINKTVEGGSLLNVQPSNDGTDSDESETQKVKNIASQLGKTFDIGKDGIVTVDDIKKMFPGDSLKNLLSKGIFGVFSEEVNRIKQLMK